MKHLKSVKLIAMTTDPTRDDHVIYGLLNADISDNATVYCAIPFVQYMVSYCLSQ